MHIGILTGGGDCPGLNAVIRMVTLALIHQVGARVTGIERGFHGLLTRSVRPLDEHSVQNILAQGGTILGTHNKCDPFHYFAEGGRDASADAMAYVRELGLDALVAIGGDGTMFIANRFCEIGLPVVGVPKTIDNDLAHTERTFGFDSAVAVVAEALDRLQTTARSHGRVMIVETMGRYAGWIALEGGIAGGADVILLPELPFSVPEVITYCQERERHRDDGGGYTLICVAEGAHASGEGLTISQTVADSPDPIRLGGICHALQAQLQPHLQSEVRTTQLGHTQRGGAPTPFDRVLATEFGFHAAQLIRAGRYGRMVTWRQGGVDSVPLGEVAGKNRTVPDDHPLLEAARALGVCLGTRPAITAAPRR
jgi:6-phosphofructokinase 1